MFHVECACCKIKSPPTDSTVVLPVGWVAVVKPAGAGSVTTFQCFTCPK